MMPPRFFADARLLMLAAILLASCGSVATKPTSSPTGSNASAAAASPGQASAPAAGSSQPAGGGGYRGTGHDGGGSSGGQPGVPSPAPAANPDAGVLGSMSRGFLRPAPYSTVNLEVDVAGGATPSSAVISEMVGLLGRETAKPVTQAGGHSLAGHGTGCWSDSDIAAAAAQRTAHTRGSTASLLALFLDGSYCGDSNVLGLAFGATSMLVFTAQVEQLATITVGPDQFMKSVVNHEMGHILGLVNIGYQSHINHEDAAHAHHSSNNQSVMYWAIDQGNLIQQFVNGPPQNFDSNDEADLAGLRDGTY